jgi:hypothetical protein
MKEKETEDPPVDQKKYRITPKIWYTILCLRKA